MSSSSTGMNTHTKSSASTLADGTQAIVSATNTLAAAATNTKAAATQNAAKAFRSWQVQNYPLQLWWFVAAFAGVCMLLYGASLVRRQLRLRAGRLSSPSNAQGKEGEPVQQGKHGAASWRNLATGMATVWKVTLYRWSLPISWDANLQMTVIEIFSCSAYMVACLTWAYVLSNGPSDYANRNGWLALSQTSLVVGLAGKNNVLSYLTGVGPEKLQILHRSAGRTLLILSCTHAFGRYSIGLNGAHAIYQPIMIWGTVALTSFALTTVLGFRWIRRRFYEFFLWSHIILVFFFLLGAYFHKPSTYLWVYPAFALWAADRLARLLRALIINRLCFLPSSKAHVQVLSDCTLRLTLRRPLWFKAGQHAYLCLPGVSALPWEHHPFTLACSPLPGWGVTQDLTFIIRARDGFTRRLMKRAQKSGGACDLWAVVDGAYGCPPGLEEYETVLLLAGGSGVSYTFSLLSAVLASAREGNGLVKRVVWVWVVRREEHLGWVARELCELLAGVPRGVAVEIRLFVTHSGNSVTSTLAGLPTISEGGGEKGAELVDDQEKEKEKGKSLASPARSESYTSMKTLSVEAEGQEEEEGEVGRLLGLPQVRLEEGRPEVLELVREVVEGAEGAVSVGVCGPAGLSNAVRSALTHKDVVGFSKSLKGGASVDLHVETFGW